MEIYMFQSPTNIFLNILYAFGAIAFAVVAFFIIRFFIGQVKAYRQSQEKFPFRLRLFLALILIVPLVGSTLFGISFVKSLSYDYNMEKGNASFLEGDVILVFCEENYYRGTFMGYNVVLQIEGQSLEPSNTFSKEIVEYFESDEKLLIQYGEIKNDGTYIWSIKTTEK